MGLYPGAVNKYAPAANPVGDGDYVSSLWDLNGICNVAADGAGSVYAVTWPEGPVMKYEALQFSALQAPANGAMSSESGRAAAVDLASGDLYVSHPGEIAQYDQGGGLLASFTGAPEDTFGNSREVAIAQTTGDVYVPDNEHSRVDVFGPKIVVPDLTTEAASSITTTTATLHGTVNPDGVPVTTCEFQYGPSNYDQVAPCTANPGSGSSPVEVSANVSGLLQTPPIATGWSRPTKTARQSARNSTSRRSARRCSVG